MQVKNEFDLFLYGCYFFGSSGVSTFPVSLFFLRVSAILIEFPSTIVVKEIFFFTTFKLLATNSPALTFIKQTVCTLFSEKI